MSMKIKINEDLAELVRVLIGDGYTHHSKNGYQIGFVGSPMTDREYYEILQK